MKSTPGKTENRKNKKIVLLHWKEAKIEKLGNKSTDHPTRRDVLVWGDSKLSLSP